MGAQAWEIAAPLDSVSETIWKAKYRVPQDSVARKVMLLNNLSINSAYNFLADSFKLAPISISANTNILDNLLNINLSASLDPYWYKTVH